MNPEELAALERLLEYVGRGFCAVQEECRMLRKYLKTLPVLECIDDVVPHNQGSGVITQETAASLRQLDVGETMETEQHRFTKLSDNAVLVRQRDPEKTKLTVVFDKPATKKPTKKPIAKKRKR